MIEKYQLRLWAKQFLQSNFKEYPSALSFLFEPERFDVWVSLLEYRLKQLEESNYVRSREAIQQFTYAAAAAYAKAQLKKSMHQDPYEKTYVEIPEEEKLKYPDQIK